MENNYNTADLKQMEINALALRNIADQQLELLGRINKKSARPSAKKSIVERKASLVSRIITGNKKPAARTTGN